MVLLLSTRMFHVGYYAVVRYFAHMQGVKIGAMLVLYLTMGIPTPLLTFSASHTSAKLTREHRPPSPIATRGTRKPSSRRPATSSTEDAAADAPGAALTQVQPWERHQPAPLPQGPLQIGSCKGPINYAASEPTFHPDDIPASKKASKAFR